MSKKTDDESLPLILYPFIIVITILFIVFTLVTFGVFLSDKDEKKEHQVKRKNKSVEESLRIIELEAIKQQIMKNERRILFAVRLIIASTLVTVNYLYLQQTSGSTSDSKNPFLDIDKIANLNTCILLLYSLPAYILFGTIEKFTYAMKIKTTTILRRKHIPTLSELKLLKDQEIRLKNEIHYLEMQLEQFN